ncbi:hypothetical protein Dimus_037363, partial [Dionaea muscipula]
MGEVVGRDTMPALAWNFRHGGGGGRSLRLRRQAAKGFEGSNQLRDSSRPNSAHAYTAAGECEEKGFWWKPAVESGGAGAA